MTSRKKNEYPMNHKKFLSPKGPNDFIDYAYDMALNENIKGDALKIFWCFYKSQPSFTIRQDYWCDKFGWSEDKMNDVLNILKEHDYLHIEQVTKTHHMYYLSPEGKLTELAAKVGIIIPPYVPTKRAMEAKEHDRKNKQKVRVKLKQNKAKKKLQRIEEAKQKINVVEPVQPETKIIDHAPVMVEKNVAQPETKINVAQPVANVVTKTEPPVFQTPDVTATLSEKNDVYNAVLAERNIHGEKMTQVKINVAVWDMYKKEVFNMKTIAQVEEFVHNAYDKVAGEFI